MRIGLVCGYISEQYGGIPKVALSVSQALEKMGIIVEGWATKDSNSFQNEKWNLAKTSFPKSWFFAKGFAHALNESITQYDLLHMMGTWNYPVFSGGLLAKKNDIPYIVSPHGGLQGWRLKQKYFKKKIYYDFLLSNILSRAVCLHAVNDTEAMYFRQAGYRGDISIIGNGIDVDALTDSVDYDGVYEKWPSLNNKKIVLYMSRISPEKGLDILIPAWKKHIAKFKDDDEVLVIAGPDDRGYLRKVKALVQNYGISSSIVFTGMVKGGIKNALFNLADYFVLPSHSENFGLVVGEAMAAGLPVITTTGTPWRDLDNLGAGYCIDPQINTLKEALCLMSSHSSRQKRRMGELGAKYIINFFSWDAIGKKYLQLYESIGSSGEACFLYEG